MLLRVVTKLFTRAVAYVTRKGAALHTSKHLITFVVADEHIRINLNVDHGLNGLHLVLQQGLQSGPASQNRRRKKKKCDENDSSTWTLEFLAKKAEEDNIKLPKGNRGFKLAYYRKEMARKQSEIADDLDYVP